MTLSPAMQIILVAVVGGVVGVWVGHVVRIPAIVFLLCLGILLGPDGLHWMPLPAQHLGEALPAIVGIGVAVILFEGGLSLNVKDFRLAPKAVRNLLTVGALVSFLGAWLVAWTIGGLSGSGAALYGALMIVTGPTVVVPLLKQARVIRRVHSILLWEGILVDAIGALTAVVVLEIILEQAGVIESVGGLVLALLMGPLLGICGGWLLSKCLLARIARDPKEDEVNRLLMLAGALAIYGISERIVRESGLSAVIAGGMMVANMMGRRVEELRRFKGTLSTLIIAVLFMLLAANFNVSSLRTIWPNGFLAILLLMVVIRPLSVILSTQGSGLPWRERFYLGWIGPRGIIAASVASLFALILQEHGDPETGETLVTLTFATVMVTVLLNGLTAAPLAGLLGIRLTRPEGILIVGANEFGREIAGQLQKRGLPILLVDRNPIHCEEARESGLPVVEGDALHLEFLEMQDLSGFGRLLAVTGNSSVNARACTLLAETLNFDPCLFVVSKRGQKTKTVRRALDLSKGTIAFSKELDIEKLNILLKDGKVRILEEKITDQAPTRPDPKFLPLLLVRENRVSVYGFDLNLRAGDICVGMHFGKMPKIDLPFKNSGKINRGYSA